MHRAGGRSSGSEWVREGARASEGLCPDIPGGVYVGNARRAWGEAVCVCEHLARRCAGISPLRVRMGVSSVRAALRGVWVSVLEMTQIGGKCAWEVCV